MLNFIKIRKRNLVVCNIFISIFTIFLLFFYNCSSNDNDNTKDSEQEVLYVQNSQEGKWGRKKKLNFEEVVSIGIDQGDSNYTLHKPIAIDVDKDGNIYICDQGEDKIKVYNKEGRFIRNIGRKGSGPGELINPYLLIIAKNKHLLVIDSQRTINFYSLSGTFINSFRINEGRPYSLFCDSIKDKIFLTFAIPPFLNSAEQYKAMVYTYNFKGNVINTFGKLYPIGDAPSGKQYALGFVSGDQGKLFLAYESLYRIEKFNKEGELGSVVACKTDFFPPPKLIELSVPVKMIMTRSEIKVINFFPDSKFLLTIFDKGSSFAEDYKNYSGKPGFVPEGLKVHYDLFDQQGHLLQSFMGNISTHGVIFHIDSNGYVYTISSPDQIPVVKKYKISFK